MDENSFRAIFSLMHTLVYDAVTTYGNGFTGCYLSLSDMNKDILFILKKSAHSGVYTLYTRCVETGEGSMHYTFGLAREFFSFLQFCYFDGIL